MPEGDVEVWIGDTDIERHGACSGGVCIQLECQSDRSTPREATCTGDFNRD